jgi:hypothetical protein
VGRGDASRAWVRSSVTTAATAAGSLFSAAVRDVSTWANLSARRASAVPTVARPRCWHKATAAAVGHTCAYVYVWVDR